jgi:hypothetical protein
VKTTNCQNPPFGGRRARFNGSKFEISAYDGTMNKEILNDRQLYLNEPGMALDFLVRNLGFVVHAHTEFQKPGIVNVYDRSQNSYEVLLNTATNENRACNNKLIIYTSDCLQEYHDMHLKGILIITKPYYVPEGLVFEISDYWNNRYILMEQRDYNE